MNEPSLNIFKKLTDLVFPIECLCCETAGAFLCLNCQKNCLGDSPPLPCPLCHKTSFCGLTHPKCRQKRNIDAIFAAGSFNNPVLSLSIKKFKYHQVKGLAEPLACFAGEKITQQLGDLVHTLNPTLVPVPLHRRKLKQRGYNQAALLGEELAKYLKLAFEPNLLQRNKQNNSQVDLPKIKRQENVKNIFTLTETQKLGDKNYFIVDDVYTTGATIIECAKVLKKHGAGTVWGVAIAHEILIAKDT